MDQVQKLIAFLKDVRAETGRVQWPDRRQTTLTTTAVLVFVGVTGVYLAGVDFLVSRLMEWMLR